MTSEEKLNHLNAVHYAWSNCQACMLCKERKNVVYGTGNPDAKIMIVGEAPGANEDRDGIPFVGHAGVLLDQYLGQVSANQDVIDLVGQDRPEERRNLLLPEYYYTNAVCCRPPENRDPTPTEVEVCKPRLWDQIRTIEPRLILALGKIAVEALVSKKISITAVRGTVYDVDLPGVIYSRRIAVVAMLHPAFLLRQMDYKTDGGHMTNMYKDMVMAHHILDLDNKINFGIPRPRNDKGMCIRCEKRHKDE